MKINKLIIITMIAAVVLAGCQKPGTKKAVDTKKAKEKYVKVETALVGNVSRKVKAGAAIDAFKEVEHFTETGGDVKNVLVTNGKWVKEGDKIIEFTNDQIEMQYNQSNAQFLSAKAQYERTKKFAKDQVENNLIKAERAMISAKMALQKAKAGTKKEQIDQLNIQVDNAKAGVDTIKLTYENNKKLYEKNLISEQQYLQVKNQYDSAENGYKAAQKNLEIAKKGADDEDIKTLEAAVKDAEDSFKMTKKMKDEETWKYDIQAAESAYLSAESAMKMAEKRFNDLTVTARIAGVVGNLEIEEQNKVPAGTPLFTIMNNDDMTITVGLNEKEIVGVQKYNKAEIYVEAVEGYYNGSVYEINPIADSKTRKFDVKIKIKNNEHLLKKGMYGTAAVVSGENEAMLVPKQAIIVSGLNSYVFKVEDGIAKKVSVELGTGEEDRQEIISDDISEGDDIVVEGQFLLNDGEKVKISEVK